MISLETFEPQQTNRSLWHQSTDSPHLTLSQHIDTLRQESDIEARYIEAESLYTGQDCTSLYPYQLRPAFDTYSINNEDPEINVIYSITDTLVNRLYQLKPRPFFQLIGALWEASDRASLMQKWNDALFKIHNVYPVAQEAIRDACKYGNGYVKVGHVNGELFVERVFPWLITMDDAYSPGKHRTRYETRYLTKDELLDLVSGFKEKPRRLAAEDAINEAAYESFDALTSSDRIRVDEAWRLSSSKGKKNGRHVIALKNFTLVDERDLELNEFPFVDFVFPGTSNGFLKLGIPDLIGGIQRSLNYYAKVIRINHVIGASAVTYYQKGSTEKHFLEKSYIPGTLIPVDDLNNTPRTVTTPLVSQEVYAYKQELTRQAYEIIGVSQLSASQVKPVGMNAGIAIRTVQDIESARFTCLNEMFQDAICRIAELLARASKEAYSGTGKKVTWPNGRFVEQIAWDDIDFDEDVFHISIMSTGILPSTPGAKFQTFFDLAKEGLIDKPQFLKALESPDLEQFYDLANGPLDDINMIIEEILKGGDVVPPDEYMNLELAIKQGLHYRALALVRGADKANVDKLTRWIDEVKELITSAQPPPEQGATPAGEGAPPAGMVPPATVNPGQTLGKLPPQEMPGAPPMPELPTEEGEAE